MARARDLRWGEYKILHSLAWSKEPLINSIPSTLHSTFHPPSCRRTLSRPHRPFAAAPTRSASQHHTRIKAPRTRHTTPFLLHHTMTPSPLREVQPTTSPPQSLGEAAATAGRVIVTLTTVLTTAITIATAVPIAITAIDSTVPTAMYAFQPPHLACIY